MFRDTLFQSEATVNDSFIVKVLPFWKRLGYDRTFCPVISLAEEKKDAVPFWDSVNRKPVLGTRYRFGIESRFVTPSFMSLRITTYIYSSL